MNNITFNKVNSKIDTQLANEMYYNKEAVYDRIEKEIDREPEIQECMFQATRAIYEWAENYDHVESEMRERVSDFIANNTIGFVVRAAMVLVMHLDDKSAYLETLAGQLAGSIKGLYDKHEQIQTAAEVLTLMGDADCFDMTKRVYETEDGEETKWLVENPWELSKATVKHIKRGMYLPPMIVKPLPLEKNTDSAYLSIERDSVILGRQNHHDGEVCLDSLNRFNAIPLSINVPFILAVEKQMENEALGMDSEALQQYQKFNNDSAFVFSMMMKHGNKPI